MVHFIVLPVAGAQVYKWRDAHGKLHFSDKPPPDRRDMAPIAGTGQSTRRTGKEVDLRATLEEKHAPRTPVEHATLAVVFVKAALGTGSGFFISTDGYVALW